MPLELARTKEMTREQLTRTLRNATVADDRTRDHVRIIAGPQPYRHAHYSADQFFQADSRAGIVTNIYGQRVLRGTLDYLGALTRALNARDPAKAAAVLYRIGRTWGEANIREFAPRIAQEYEVEFEKLGMGVMLESWWWPLRASGWGRWQCDFRHSRRGLVLINLFESAAAAAVGRTGAVACHLYAGLFASAFSFLARRELACVELACVSRGDSKCGFLVASPGRIDAATIQREQGVASELIVEQLTAT
jgi:predicted hydrocarbon binding protein